MIPQIKLQGGAAKQTEVAAAGGQISPFGGDNLQLLHVQSSAPLTLAEAGSSSTIH